MPSREELEVNVPSGPLAYMKYLPVRELLIKGDLPPFFKSCITLVPF